jgi:transaldolase/glucose-6-phosphate isomerase
VLRATNLPDRYNELLSQFERARVLSRLWAHDYTVWSPEPREITNRLGWLHAPFSMMPELDRLDAFAKGVRANGFEHVLLLGMGGSSLAPETFARTFGATPNSPDVTVLDSTHPAAIAAVESRLDLSRTLFLVATKSGTTTETLSLFRYFFNRALEEEEAAKVGARFVAITDPGSPLGALAVRHGFREVFLNDPNIGGRYSALSLFGLVPAALLGIDIERLLKRAQRIAIESAAHASPGENTAVRLGLILATCTVAGRDKATFLLPPELASFGGWVEQLIAESTGKEGIGILPIVGEPVGAAKVYGDDRMFIVLTLRGKEQDDDAISELDRAGHPIVRIEIDGVDSLGDQFFLWELATAVAAHVLKINPFDQPNVESAKTLARELVNTFRRTGALPPGDSTLLEADGLAAFLDGIGAPDYLAIQAYLPPSERLTDAFTALRIVLRDRLNIATTFGYGPRFLHSTGQLHKGDRGNGRFVQLVSDVEADLPIPDEVGSAASSLTFGTLISAQAGGDRLALLGAGRSVAVYAVPVDPSDLIHRVAADLGRSSHG